MTLFLIAGGAMLLVLIALRGRKLSLGGSSMTLGTGDFGAGSFDPVGDGTGHGGGCDTGGGGDGSCGGH